MRADRKPIELLHRVLDALHSDGMLGFVLPYTILSGDEFREVRRRIADRFGSVEIVELPEENVFFISRHRSALLIAYEPPRGDNLITITFKSLEKTDREPFLAGYTFTRQDQGYEDG